MKYFEAAPCSRNGEGPFRKTIGIVEAMEAWHSYFDAGRKESSRSVLRGLTRCFTRHFRPRKKVVSFTRDDIAKWVKIARTEDNLRGRHIKNILGQVKSFFQFCVEDGLLPINPVQLRRLPTIPLEQVRRVPFTFEQYQRLHQVLARSPDRYHDYWPLAITLGYYTGLRVGDCASLRWEFDQDGRGSRVNFDDEIIIVYPQKRDSVRQRLEIPMERELYERLLRWRNQKAGLTASPYVMPMFHGHRLAEVHSGYFRSMADEAGLPEHSFHSFRHGFVTRLINAGVDPVIIASMTGQSMEMIQRYAHVSPEAQRAALDQAREALHKAELARLGMAPTPAAMQL